MAFLMLLHEKMSLRRKVNKLTMRQLKVSHRKERIAKNIAKVQKMYSSKMTQLEKSVSILQKQFTNGLQNSCGLGTANQMWNPMSGGLTTFVYQSMGQMLSGAVNIPNGQKDANGNPITNSVDISGKWNEMLQEQMSNTLVQSKDQDGKALTGTDGKPLYGSNGQFTQDEYKAFTQAYQQSLQAQSGAQMYCQQMTASYEQAASIWLEAAKSQLEEEQEEALAPLEMEDTELDLENESLETQLADAKARLESVTQACSESIKDSAPKFGLG